MDHLFNHILFMILLDIMQKNKKSYSICGGCCCLRWVFNFLCWWWDLCKSKLNCWINRVICSSFGFKDLIEKIGVQRQVYTVGKNKSTLDPFLDEKKEDIDRLKSIQTDLHKNFIKVVTDSRSKNLIQIVVLNCLVENFGLENTRIRINWWYWKCEWYFKRKIWWRRHY